MPDHVIETAQLRKSFDGHEALRGLDPAVPAWSMVGSTFLFAAFRILQRQEY